MTLTERDRRLLTFAPALLAVALFAWRVLLPGWDAHDALTRRLETAGRVPEAWESRLAVAEKGRQAAEGELEKERRRFADGMRELRREQPAANSTVRTKPGALVALNRSVAASGAKIVAAGLPAADVFFVNLRNAKAKAVGEGNLDLRPVDNGFGADYHNFGRLVRIEGVVRNRRPAKTLM